MANGDKNNNVLEDFLSRNFDEELFEKRQKVTRDRIKRLINQRRQVRGRTRQDTLEGLKARNIRGRLAQKTARQRAQAATRGISSSIRQSRNRLDLRETKRDRQVAQETMNFLEQFQQNQDRRRQRRQRTGVRQGSAPRKNTVTVQDLSSPIGGRERVKRFQINIPGRTNMPLVSSIDEAEQLIRQQGLDKDFDVVFELGETDEATRRDVERRGFPLVVGERGGDPIRGLQRLFGGTLGSPSRSGTERHRSLARQIAEMRGSRRSRFQGEPTDFKTILGNILEGTSQTGQKQESVFNSTEEIDI